MNFLLQKNHVWHGHTHGLQILFSWLLAGNGVAHGLGHCLKLLHARVHDLQGSVVLSVGNASLALPVVLNPVVGVIGLLVVLVHGFLGLQVLYSLLIHLLLLCFFLVGITDFVLPAVVHAIQKTKHHRAILLVQSQPVHLLEGVSSVDSLLFEGWLRGCLCRRRSTISSRQSGHVGLQAIEEPGCSHGATCSQLGGCLHGLKCAGR